MHETQITIPLACVPAKLPVQLSKMVDVTSKAAEKCLSGVCVAAMTSLVSAARSTERCVKPISVACVLLSHMKG